MFNLAGREKSDGRIVPVQEAREDNKLRVEDRSAHDWYRFVLSYPAHLVRAYVERFGLDARQNVLDPFCGTGTTIVECKKLGIPSCGIEPNPMAVFASRTKVDWEINADELVAHASHIAKLTLEKFNEQGIQDEDIFDRLVKPYIPLRELPPDLVKILLTDSISPLPLHKVLVLIEVLEANRDPRLLAHEHLALAKILVNDVSNLHFGPEIGVGKIKTDSAVVGPWVRAVSRIAEDIRHLQAKCTTPAIVHQADARD